MSQSKEKQFLETSYMTLEKTQQDLEKLKEQGREPVAVIGLACRFPGGANTPDRLWQLLESGVDSSSEIPEERWRSDRYYNPDPGTPGTTHANRANLLKEPVDEFDAPFFNISAKEARAIDPQHRLLMEISWEALENAGLDAAGLSGSQTGVYVGISSDDYSLAHRHSIDYSQIDAYSLTATSLSTSAGRISYYFGFEGPCMALDTACSSSLVALHLACQALRNKEIDLALVGGVNLILSPSYHICTTKLGTTSPDGRCKTFDASADGYGRGEGCGIVVLKRLSEAIGDKDPVRLVIRGTAVNQDGKSNGLTAPNGLSQEKVIRSALKDSGLSPADIDYIETHGTGTPLGDPIEVESIARVMGKEHTEENPVRIGSVKINIGHLEPASGIAGLFKVMLAMRNQALPPHFQFKDPNPYVAWEEIPIKVPTELTPWQKEDSPLRAGISSFGFSGTNAHVIVEEASSLVTEQETKGHKLIQDRSCHLLPLSAKSETVLNELAVRYSQHLGRNKQRLSDVCHTAGVGRTHFNHRLAVIGQREEEVEDKLKTFSKGQKSPGCFFLNRTSSKPEVAFAFTGQGSQYVGMGKELYDSSPVFREAMNACDAGLRPCLNDSLLDLLYGQQADDTILMQTRYTQPAIFALEYSLARLWLSWGVTPDIVLGHSIGEYAAACIAGIMSLDDALRLVAARGELLQSLPENGNMAAIFASEEEMLSHVHLDESLVSLAAVNAPESVVISGEKRAVGQIVHQLNQKGISAKELNVSHAFHSPLVDPILNQFEHIADKVAYQSPNCSVISTVSGQFIQKGELASAKYWSQQIRRPVRFRDAVERLASEGSTIVLEIGAMPILSGLARRTLTNDLCSILHSMEKGMGDWKTMLHALGQMYVQGVSVDWKNYDRPYQRKRVSGPTYPFQRKSFYVHPVQECHQQGPGLAMAGQRHPYLGEPIDSPLIMEDTTLFQAYFTEDWPDFLRQHKIFDKIISPGAAHLSMALSAWRNEKGNVPCVLENVDMTQPLVIEGQGGRIVQMVLEEQDTDQASFRLMSRDGLDRKATWINHCQGQIRTMAESEDVFDLMPIEEIKARCNEKMTWQELYSYIKSLGYRVGPLFQCVRDIYQGVDESLCLVRNVHEIDEMAVYPGLVDSFLQTVLPALEQNEKTRLDGEHVLIPLHFKKIQFQKGLDGDLYCHTQASLLEDAIQCQIRVANASGAVVLDIEGFLLKYTDRKTLYRELNQDIQSMVFLTRWEECDLHEAETLPSKGQPSKYLLFDDKNGFGQPIMDMFCSKGQNCIRVAPGDLFEQKSDKEYIVRPESLEDVSCVLGHVLLQDKSGPLQIIYCRGSKDRAAQGLNADDLEQAEQGVVQGLLTVIQALQSRNWTAQAKIWLITEQTQPAYNQDPFIDPISAPLWGLGRTLAMEYPEMWGGLIDLESNPTDKAYTALVDQIAGQSPNDQMAISQNGRLYAARLIPSRKRQKGQEQGALSIPVCSGQEGYFLDTGNKGTLDELNFQKRARRDP
ncbi:MAG TPA: type I polyketide synthase, partial [Desulfohalobiaceae bacterium]|nr:type I polyketide synthase [Desulfohalobiaceae bacterium]